LNLTERFRLLNTELDNFRMLRLSRDISDNKDKLIQAMENLKDQNLNNDLEVKRVHVEAAGRIRIATIASLRSKIESFKQDGDLANVSDYTDVADIMEVKILIVLRTHMSRFFLRTR
jgi:hypothetical protein